MRIESQLKLEDKVPKGTKLRVVDEILNFHKYDVSLFDGKTICGERMLLDNTKDEVYTVNKYGIALKVH